MRNTVSREELSEGLSDYWAIYAPKSAKKRAEETISSAQKRNQDSEYWESWISEAENEALRLCDKGGVEYSPETREKNFPGLWEQLVSLRGEKNEAGDMLRQAKKKAAVIKKKAAKETGKKYTSLFPELWQSFGKYIQPLATVAEKVLKELPEAVRHSNEDADSPDPLSEFRGTPFVPLESYWALSQEALKRYWFSVGCDPLRAWECSRMWIATARALGQNHNYDRGIHWGDAFENASDRIRAASPRGGGDWKRIALGIIRSIGPGTRP